MLSTLLFPSSWTAVNSINSYSTATTHYRWSLNLPTYPLACYFNHKRQIPHAILLNPIWILNLSKNKFSASYCRSWTMLLKLHLHRHHLVTRFPSVLNSTYKSGFTSVVSFDLTLKFQWLNVKPNRNISLHEVWQIMIWGSH